MVEPGLAATELVPDRLYLLGDSVPLDGRVTWVPGAARGWQPVNAYLLIEGSDCLVIDPGVSAHRSVVAGQLEQLLAPGATVSIFLTRAEPDTAGNIGEIASRFPVHRLYAGGGPNPFDAFEAASQLDSGRGGGERIQMERMPPGFQIPVGGERAVQVMRPAIRLLATWWGYDQLTGTLFSSDSFGHTVQTARDDPRTIGPGDDPQTNVVTVKQHLLAKFGWLASAKTPEIANNLRQLVRGLEIERIAPGHGLVIEGKDMVRAHLRAVERALAELAK